MRRILILLLIGHLVNPSYSQDTRSIASKILKSTVSIITKDKDFQTLALGSGFIINDEIIVTNLHVIEGAKHVYVVKNNTTDEIHSTGYVAVDKINDLALLKVPLLQGPSIEINQTSLPSVGEQIFVAGNPQ